jgi:uncharacterized protein (TIGR02118 family)
MKRMIVLYGKPADPAAFNRYFHETHVPLVLKMPHLVSFEVSSGPVALGAGDTSKYHLVAQLAFKSQAECEASLASPEGQAVVADVPNYATGTVEIITIDTHSFR